MWFAVTLFCVVTISFFMMRSVRGGPFDGETVTRDPATGALSHQGIGYERK